MMVETPMQPHREVPEPDQVTRPWWDATREMRLLVQRCSECEHVQHYPRAVCTECGSKDLGWLPCSGQGRVHSFTVVHRSPREGFEPPYVVGLIQLEEGPVLMSNILAEDPSDIRCDDPVKIVWERIPDGRHLPLFSLDKDH